jgi:hypothetical protein
MMILKTSRSNLSSNDQLSLDLPFAATKSLTARVGPTPTFTRGSGATYIGSDGLIHGVDTSTTSNSISAASKTFTLAATAGQDQLWRPGDAVEASNGSNIMVGTVTSYDADTQSLVCNMTSISGIGTFTSWRIGYRGPRFDHTSAGVCRGLLIEEGRTNLVFPSETLTTQTRTVTAVPHTLSFYGTGTVVLSGVHSATVVGTGAYPTRTTLTFTPTAGSLILTVTGSVTQAQLEAGSFPTSYIPTTTGTLARGADVCGIANTSSFWNSDQFTLFGDANFPNPAHDAYAVNFSITSGFFGVRRPNTNTAAAIIRSFGVNADISLGTFVTGTMRMAVAHSSGQQAAAFNGGSATQASSAFSPSLNPALNIGYSGSAGYINGHVAAIRYYRKRLPNAKLAQLTV